MRYNIGSDKKVTAAYKAMVSTVRSTIDEMVTEANAAANRAARAKREAAHACEEQRRLFEQISLSLGLPRNYLTDHAEVENAKGGPKIEELA